MGTGGSISPPSAKDEAQQILELLEANTKSSGRIACASLLTSLCALLLSGSAVYYASKDASDDTSWRNDQIGALEVIQDRLTRNTESNTSDLSKLVALASQTESQGLEKMNGIQAAIEKLYVATTELNKLIDEANRLKVEQDIAPDR